MAVPGSPNIMGPSFSDDDAKVFKPAPHTSREPLLDKEQAPCAPCLSLPPPPPPPELQGATALVHVFIAC